jgi:hypothetical protein
MARVAVEEGYYLNGRFSDYTAQERSVSNPPERGQLNAVWNPMKREVNGRRGEAAYW